MRRTGKETVAVLVAAIVVAVVGCGQNNGGAEARNGGTVVEPPFATFRDVPGITLGEIAAIEKLQGERSFFTFAGNASTDIFPKIDVGGGGGGGNLCRGGGGHVL
jgi:hypothetical protein